LALFKENLPDLNNGQWLGNIIIDFFTSNLFDMLNKLGIKNIYYMHLAKHQYDFSECHRVVTKKEANDDGHIFPFIFHKVVVVTINMNNAHWIFFAICPANLDILVIDSLYDPTSLFHVTIYQNMVQFIDDYQQSKYFPQDRWACGICVPLL
jgi:Ulp1 family protease